MSEKLMTTIEIELYDMWLHIWLDIWYMIYDYSNLKAGGCEK